MRSARGWYHDCEVGHFGEIWFHDDAKRIPGSANVSAFGPFKTFSEAKVDAIAYHRADVWAAQGAIREIRFFRKPRKAEGDE